MRGTEREAHGRGLGPFSGGQLTIIIVAICAVFALPATAFAAAGAFSNSSSTVPAVQGTNSNAKGIGVKGTGKRFGVYSNGNLGVAAGKSLKCVGCVTVGNMSGLQPGDDFSGVFGDDDVYPAGSPGHLTTVFSFRPPNRRGINVEIGPSAHCSNLNKKSPATYLCLYPSLVDAAFDSTTKHYSEVLSNIVQLAGVSVRWNQLGGGEASVFGHYRYTV